MSNQVQRKDNHIIVEGRLTDFNFRRLLSEIHKAINERGYQDIVLDFSRCASAFPNSMLGICAQVLAYRRGGIDFSLTAPDKRDLANLFHNANWAHFLDPRQCDPSKFRGHTRIPATQYRSAREQQSSVNKIVNVILGAVPDMSRADFAAFEWSVNEITDNVLVHSDSPVGGLVQVSTFRKTHKQVQFVVADPGYGIPYTLRSNHSDINSDTDALNKAIREGVTRDKAVGQGNGLFGSYEICSKSGGAFDVVSGHANLSSRGNELSINNERIPFDGTLVSATIDFSEPELLGEALRFGGEKYSPVDFVETEYATRPDGKIIFHLLDEAPSFGSRVAGRPVRIKLKNLMHMQTDQKILIDFQNVPIVSSSFADEAFGKLFLEAGPVEFMHTFEFINALDTIKRLVDRAIAQRMAVGVSD